MILNVFDQNAFPIGDLMSRKKTGGEEEEGKDAMKKLSKEQRVELLRMFNRCNNDV